MPKKHHRKHHKQEREGLRSRTDEEERRKGDVDEDIDDDASNSTADSMADADDDALSSQDSEERQPEPSGIKLVLKMSSSETGLAPEYSPSHVYSPGSFDDKRKKHKKKKKKKSSDREKHHHYQEESLDDEKKIVTPFKISTSAAFTYDSQSDDAYEPCNKKRKLAEVDDSVDDSVDEEKIEQGKTNENLKEDENDNDNGSDEKLDDVEEKNIGDFDLTKDNLDDSLVEEKSDSMNETVDEEDDDTLKGNTDESVDEGKEENRRVTVSEDDLNVSYEGMDEDVDNIKVSQDESELNGDENITSVEQENESNIEDTTDEKLDTTDEKLYNNDEKLDNNDEKLDNTAEKLDDNDEKFDNDHKKFDHNDEKLTNTADNLDTTNTDDENKGDNIDENLENADKHINKGDKIMENQENRMNEDNSNTIINNEDSCISKGDNTHDEQTDIKSIENDDINSEIENDPKSVESGIKSVESTVQTDENSRDGETYPSGDLGVVNELATDNKPSKMLKPLLNHIHKSIIKYDMHGIFAFPVNDLIAPGYSSIITQPMDLSTMASKISAGIYGHVGELRVDFELMCSNAMTYNQNETIYYKEADRILQCGNKLMSREKLLKMIRNHSHLSGVTMRDLGLDLPHAVVPLERLTENEISQHTVPSPAPSQTETLEDQVAPDDILAQAQAAAKGAAHMLTLRKPNSKFGFLRRRPDGSTSINFINPDNNGMVSETERHVDIGAFLGKPSAGTTSIQGFKEDRRNKVTTVNYLNYGPFSSYAPHYDSSFATVSKDESDLLLSTYKDDIGVSYAKSVMSFVDTAGDYAVKMVNQLLDMLTKGEHSKTQALLEENKKTAEEDAKRKAEQEVKQTEPIDFESLESLSDLGIDTAFLNSFKTPPVDPLQQQLDNTANLLHDLEKTQHNRLNQPPPVDLNQVITPSKQEIQLANQVCDKLKDISKQLNPGDISSVEGIRKAMGITLQPMETTDTGSHVTHQPMDTSVAETSQKSEQDIQMELERLLDESANVNNGCPPLAC